MNSLNFMCLWFLNACIFNLILSFPKYLKKSIHECIWSIQIHCSICYETATICSTLRLNRNMFSSVVYQNAASGAPCSVGASEPARSWLVAVRRQAAKDVNKSKAPLNEVRWVECLVIIVLYQLYEFSRNSFPLYAESLEGLFYFLFNYIDFSQHNNKLNSNCVYSL